MFKCSRAPQQVSFKKQAHKIDGEGNQYYIENKFKAHKIKITGFISLVINAIFKYN